MNQIEKKRKVHQMHTRRQSEALLEQQSTGTAFAKERDFKRGRFGEANAGKNVEDKGAATKTIVQFDVDSTETQMAFTVKIRRPNSCCVCTESISEDTEFDIAAVCHKKQSTNDSSDDDSSDDSSDDSESSPEPVSPANKSRLSVHGQWPSENSISNLFEQDLLRQIYNRSRKKEDRRNLINFDRICKACFERSVVTACERGSLHFTPETNSTPAKASVLCPICLPEKSRSLQTDDLLRVLSGESQQIVQVALDRLYMERTNPVFHCSVLGCKHMEVRMNLPAGRQQILKCDAHGRQCTACWERLDADKKMHECGGLPKELQKIEAADDIRRCPHCHLPMQRTRGCNDMKCKCSRNFDWSEAAQVGKESRSVPVL